VDELNIKYFRGKLRELLALLRHSMGSETLISKADWIE
jgi:hypothetical protein